MSLFGNNIFDVIVTYYCVTIPVQKLSIFMRLRKRNKVLFLEKII